jgi:hypothetical protein
MTRQTMTTPTFRVKTNQGGIQAVNGGQELRLQLSLQWWRV